MDGEIWLGNNTCQQRLEVADHALYCGSLEEIQAILYHAFQSIFLIDNVEAKIKFCCRIVYIPPGEGCRTHMECFDGCILKRKVNLKERITAEITFYFQRIDDL